MLPEHGGRVGGTHQARGCEQFIRQSVVVQPAERTFRRSFQVKLHRGNRWATRQRLHRAPGGTGEPIQQDALPARLAATVALTGQQALVNIPEQGNNFHY